MNRFCNQTDYANRKAVTEEYPEAEVIKKVEGGWMVFDTNDEYETWRNQN